MKTSREVASRCRRHRNIQGAYMVQQVRFSSASRNSKSLKCSIGAAFGVKGYVADASLKEWVTLGITYALSFPPN